MKAGIKSIVILFAAVLICVACSNPLDIVELAKNEVMEANGRFIGIDTQFPLPNTADINPASGIRIDFDRSIVPESLFIQGNITVRYSGGDNLIDDSWLVDYNPLVKRLSIEPFPFLENEKTVTVTIKDITAADGSRLKEPLEWSFTTNNDVVYSLNFGTTTTEKLYYANDALRIARGDTTVPMRLLFTRIENVKYLISGTIDRLTDLPAITNPSWITVASSYIEIENDDFPDEGEQRRFLWVYDTAAGRLLSEIPETVRITVDRTAPAFDLGNPVFANSTLTMAPVIVDPCSGIATCSWSGENCSFSNPAAESTDVTGTSQGEKIITLTVEDKAGNIAEDTVAFTWDTAAPSSPSRPDLQSADDTGISNTDNYTNITADLDFSGTAEPYSTVKLYDGASLKATVTASAAGAWSADFDSTPGTHSIRAQATDRAGNTGSYSETLTVTIDTAATASTAPDLYYGDDTGTSSSDNITSRTSGLSLTGSGVEPDASVSIYVSASPSLTSPALLNTVSANGSGSWSGDVALSEGSRYVFVISSDRAGNPATSAVLLITIDTTCSTPSVPLLYSGDDTGISNSDHITNQTSALTISGTGEPYSTVTLVVGTLTTSASVNSSGNWTTDVSRSNGTHTMSARQTDRAGNISAYSAARELQIDTIVPAAPSAPDLSYLDDTGYSNSDNLTNKTSALTLSGTCTSGSAKVEVRSGTTVLGTDSTVSGGSYSMDISRSSGTYSIAARQMDVAGNWSGNSTSLALTVDTTKPTGSITITGNTGTTSYTRSTACNLTLSYSSDTYAYYLRNDGTSTYTEDATPTTTRSWSVRANSGLRRVFYYIVDKAGNQSSTTYYDDISFERLVYVKLDSIYLNDDNETGDEEYYWRFGINGNSQAFYRPDGQTVNKDAPCWIGTQSGVSGYPQAALPYTYSTYVNVASSSGTITIEGRMFEDDGSSGDDCTSAWTYNLTTNVRGLGTSFPAASKYNLPDGTGGDDLYNVDIYVAIRADTAYTYAATGN